MRKISAAATLLLLGLSAAPILSASAETPQPAPPANLREASFRLEPSAAVAARMPAEWKEASQYHAGALRTIRYVREEATENPGQPRRAKLLLTPFLPLPSGSDLLDPAQDRSTVVRLRDAAIAQAVEKDPAIFEVAAGEMKLTGFTITDRAPNPGEFLLATSGVLRLRGLPFSITVLHNRLEVRAEVIDLLGHWSGFGVSFATPPASKPSWERLAQRCQNGDSLACGLAFEISGEEGKKDPAAVDALRRSCSAGSAFACGSLSGALGLPEDTPEHRAEALAAAARGCDAGGVLACRNLARLSAAKPLSPAFLTIFDKACAHGGDLGGACRLVAEDAPSPELYLAAREAGCKAATARDCRLLAWALETGYGQETDLASARATYEKACGLGDVWSCYRHGLWTQSLELQAVLYQSACERGSGPACWNLSLPAYQKPAEERRRLIRRACEAGQVFACMEVMAELGQAPA